MEHQTKARVDSRIPPKDVIFAILFLIALVPFALVLVGLSGCGGDPSDTTTKYFQYQGRMFQVIYTYANGECIEWQLTPQDTFGEYTGGPVEQGSNCQDVPVARAATSVSGGGGHSSGNLRQQAASSSQNILLVADAFTGVDAFDFATGAKLAAMPVHGNPFDLVSLLGQTMAYAVVFPSFGAPPSVAVVDGTQLKITANIPLPASTFPLYGALSPDGAALYVSNAGASDLSANANTSILVIDTASQRVTGSIPLPAGQNLFGNYQRLAVSPDGTLLYASSSEGYLEAIDTLTLSPVSFVRLSPGFFLESGSPTPHIVFAPDGSAAYVAVLGPKGPSIVQIDPDTSQQVGSVAIGNSTTYLSDLAITLDGGTLLAMDEMTGTTYPVDTATLTVGTAIPRTVPTGASSGQVVFSGFVIQH